MSLSAGDKLGPYEIVAPIGAGGMGEVYKARDTRLDRMVAVKVSNEQFSERFEREARAVAALNHSNICTLHDVGPNYLVMEYIEGTPLKGPLPVDQALKNAAQICDALDTAHKKGITHRDLKPANILVTKAGVKLLDFGLAKMGPAIQAGDGTMTMALTGKGEILGTFQYMSPEQVTGQDADSRSDIFSFGLVLYEMLTGKRAFEGSSPASVIAAIMERPAPTIADVAPAALDRLLQRCLAKDPDDRWQSARDLKAELEWIASAPESGKATPASSRLGRMGGVAAALALIAVASVAFALWNRPTTVQKTEVRLTIPLPPGQEITSYPAITRDGRTVAYVTQQGTEDAQLYLRDLNSFEVRAVAGSSGAKQPFFSPDGKWVAFFAQGQLQKAEVAGGTPIRLAEAPVPLGGTWSDDNTIIYTGSLAAGLMRVPASGGTPESLTKPDGAAKGYAHVFPQVLPGGRSVLFAIWGQELGSWVLSLDSHRWEMVLPIGAFGATMFDGAGGPTGRLLIVDQAAGIKAAPFDPAHPARTSADTSVLSNVYYDIELEQRGWLDVSNTGTAVYAPGNPAKTSLVWVDREGKTESLGKDQDVYREARLSPDGTKAAVRHGYQLWIHDLQRGTRSRLTSGNANNLNPIWSRDGARIIFASNRGGDWDIYSQPADGSRPAEALLKRPYNQYPVSILADGTLLYQEIHPQTGRDLWTVSPDGKASPLRVTPFNEGFGQFSPGTGGQRWVAYSSDESGQNEIYVQSYPGGANRIAVSTGGGSLPTWSSDGKELFYVSGDSLVAVATRPDGSFGAPRRLFDRSNYLLRYVSHDASPDGKRFLMIQRDPGSVPRQLNVILNWSGNAEQPAPDRNK
jgi:Tol biopolymer transport system component/predicted Ser/Thr protein kinase